MIKKGWSPDTSLVDQVTANLPNEGMDDEVKQNLVYAVEQSVSQSAKFVELFADGLPSKGTLGHSERCKACNFHMRDSCKAGKECSYCHAPHRRPSRRYRSRD